MVYVCLFLLLSFTCPLLFAHRLERRPIVQCLVLPGSALRGQRKQATNNKQLPLGPKKAQKSSMYCVHVFLYVCSRLSVSMGAECRQFVTDYHQRDSAHSALIGIRSEYHHVESVERRGEQGETLSVASSHVLSFTGYQYCRINIITRSASLGGGGQEQRRPAGRCGGGDRSQCRSVCFNHQSH